MTKKELQLIMQILSRIKEPDGKVEGAKALVNKEIKMREAQKWNFRDSYEYDSQW